MLPPSGPFLHALARIDPLPSVRGPEADVPAPTRGILATRGVRAPPGAWSRSSAPRADSGSRGAAGWRPRDRGHERARRRRRVRHDRPDRRQPAGPQRRRDRLRPARRHRRAARARAAAAGAEARPAHPRRAPLRRSSATRSTAPSTSSPGGSARPRPSTPRTPTATGPVMRSITALRGRVRPGNSGGPMIDRAGRVVATVFAAITGSTGGQGGFAVPNALVAAQLSWPRRGRIRSAPRPAPADRSGAGVRQLIARAIGWPS